MAKSRESYPSAANSSSSDGGHAAHDAGHAQNAGITLDDLPPPDTKRWGIRRKAAVVSAVAGHLITQDEACRRYNLTDEEFQSWMARVNRHGVAGLRVTRLRDYREIERREAAGDD